MAKSKKQSLEERIKVLRRKAGAAITDQDFLSIQKQIDKIESTIPEIPVPPKIFVDDVTSEALAEVLEHQDERISVLSDEGGIIGTMAGRYNSGTPNFDVYLKGHSGSPLRVNRKGRRPIYLDSPAVSMGLCVQPDVIKSLNAEPSFKGRGLLARFAYFSPLSRLGSRIIDSKVIPPPILKDYNTLIQTILSIPWNKDPATDAKVPYTLSLSPDAYDVWVDMYNKIETGLRPNGLYKELPEWAGKMPGLVIRVAGLFHVVENAYGRPWDVPIAVATVERAGDLIGLVAEHTEASFNFMNEGEGIKIARKILNWIEARKELQFTRRKIQQSMKSRFGSNEIQSGLDVLIDRNYISCKKSGIGKGKTFNLNPEALKK